LRKRLLIIIGVIVLIGILIGVPYGAWLNYEVDTVVADDASWTYPWDRGIEFNIAWTATVSDVGTLYLHGECDLQVDYTYFDIFDLPAVDTPDKPSFLDYLANYYGITTATVIPTDALFVVRLSCLFVDESGTKSWVDVSEVVGNERYYGYDETGFYSDSFVIYRHGITGEYTFSLTVLVLDAYDNFSATIAWDKVVIPVVNPYD
jgi:hypothetical protein